MKDVNDHIVAEAGEKWDQSVMRLNTKRFVILRNIRNNIRRQLPQLQTYPNNPQRVAIVGSGWSLNDTYEELRELYFDGVKLIALNGSARWLMEHNLKPAMHMMLDARPENVEFVRDPIPGCKYFFASQVDPGVLDATEGRDVTLFHAVAENADIERRRLDDYYNKRWFRVPPCGTIGITSIIVLRLLGFSHQHLFGIDSCADPKGSRHNHAFPQQLNENEGTAIFKILGKEFECSAWQASQVQNFMDLMRVNGAALDITIYGDGMIAQVVKAGGEFDLAEAKEA